MLEMAWTEMVTVRDGLNRNSHGQIWLGQRWLWSEMAGTEMVMVRDGWDRNSHGQIWLGQRDGHS